MSRTINMKKSILLAITLVIAVLMITNTASLSVKKTSTEPSLIVEKNEEKIVKLNISPEHLSLQYEEVEPGAINRLSTNGSWSVFGSVGDQLHPGFGRTEEGIQVAAFYDSYYDQIMYTFSTDEGQTFNNETLYWEFGGDYPSIKLWEGQQFHGTFVTDSQDHNGGATYLFTCTDPTDYETYSKYRWDWDQYGWHDMIDADIACSSQQESWEWGVSSYVISSTHSHGCTNSPTITFAHPSEEYSAYIQWYSINGCEHCDVDIDRDTQYMYAVYDWENTSLGMWELLVWKKDMADPLGSNGWIYEIKGTGNLRNPAVAANDDNIVILAETDENGNKDIICYYTNDGNIENLQTSFVVNTDDDEEYPDVRNFDDDDFISTYVKNNDLYGPLTEDGGVNWVEVNWQINENNDCVVEEYKISDLGESGVLAMWEEDCGGDIDIYMGYTLDNIPPGTPIPPSGPTSGYICLSYDYSTSSIDPDGENVRYGWDWDGDLVVDEWTDWYSSGEMCTVSHSWKNPRIYDVSVKAKDVYAGESNWSDPLCVTMENLPGETVYVGGSGPDNYTRIQDAINNVIDGYTVFVYDDSSPYYENINIKSKSINLIGENRDTTIIDCCKDGNVIHAKSCSHLNISGFTTRNAGIKYKEEIGILMEYCNNCIISDNILSDNPSCGILLTDGQDNQIINNIGTNNSINIALLRSKNNTIAYNDVFKGSLGIQLWNSPENIIHHNDIHNNRDQGLLLYDTSNCDIYRNNIEKHLLSGISIDGECHGNIFQYNNIKGSFEGVRISGDGHSFYFNNFIGNIRHVAIYGTGSYDFDSNYWNRPRSSPKLILGWRIVMILPPGFIHPWHPGLWIIVPKLMFDYHPAQEPYDIGM